MPNFKKEFINSKRFPAEALFKGKKIFVSDKFSIHNKNKLRFSIEKTNGKFTQGFCVRVNGYIKTDKIKTNKRKYANILFWEDGDLIDPKNIVVQIFTKEDHIFIKNIWEACDEEGKLRACYAGSGEWRKDDKWGGAAMYSEDIPNGKRYFCNDGVPDDDFDDIIFTVERLV